LRAKNELKQEKTSYNKKKTRIIDKIKKSPINYFSDLFVSCMVVAWLFTLFIMIVMAIFATVKLEDPSIWSNIENLVTVPLSAGGAIWMIKCSVQHAIANSKGKNAKMDFPKVEDAEIGEMEEEE
jgi:hypothetical protein